MIVNFHQYREDVKKSVLTWLESIDVSVYPFDYAWLVYALSSDGVENNPFFDKYLTSLVSWSNSSEAWKYDRNLGALSLLSYFLKIKGASEWKELSSGIVSRLEPLIEKTVKKKLTKHSILNTPEQFFAVIIGNKENFPARINQPLQDSLLPNTLIEISMSWRIVCLISPINRGKRTQAFSMQAGKFILLKTDYF